MREQARLLEHIADPPPARRQIRAERGIEENGPADGDAAFVRRLEPGDHVEQRGLAAARGTDKRERQRAGLDVGLDRRWPERAAHADLDHRPRPRMPRARASEAVSARTAMATAIAVSRQVAEAPAGSCVVL